MRARVRLAFERRDHDRLRRGQGRTERPRLRAWVLRGRREGRSVAQDAAADRRRVRSDRPRRDAAGLRQPHPGAGGQRRRARPVPAVSPRVLLHIGRQLVRRAAGDERCDAHGAALSLAVGQREELRRRTARGRVLRRARRDAEPGRARERRGAPGVGGARGDTAGSHTAGIAFGVRRSAFCRFWFYRFWFWRFWFWRFWFCGFSFYPFSFCRFWFGVAAAVSRDAGAARGRPGARCCEPLSGKDPGEDLREGAPGLRVAARHRGRRSQDAGRPRPALAAPSPPPPGPPPPPPPPPPP